MKKIKNKLNRPIVFFLAGILFTILITSFFNSIFKSVITDEGDVILKEAKNSPAENFKTQYTAISYVDMGGGAAGYCSKYVSVVPIYDFDKFQQAEYTIARTHCSSDDVTLRWIDNTTLEISGIQQEESNDLYNSDKKVKIIYK